MKFLTTVVFIVFFSLTAFSQTAEDSVMVENLAETAKELISPKDTSRKFFNTLGQVFGVKPYEQNEKPKVAFVRSLFFPGWGQITNRDFWKVGLVYGAAGAGYYFGIRSNNIQYQKYLSHYEKATLVSRGLAFKSNTDLSSANAFTTSSLFFVSNDADNATFYLVDTDGLRYLLNKNTGEIDGVVTDYFVGQEVSVTDDQIIGSFSATTFQSAKNQYRRWRDASYIGFAAGWLFFALEANVAAHLKTFDMSEDISLRIEPAGPLTFGQQASGIKLAFKFK